MRITAEAVILRVDVEQGTAPITSDEDATDETTKPPFDDGVSVEGGCAATASASMPLFLVALIFVRRRQRAAHR